MQSVLVLLCCVVLVRAEQVVGTYNQMLDPGQLAWWKTKWAASPITLSKSNQGSTGVSITFNFHPSTSVLAGILEVTFPSGFLASSATTSQVAVTYQGGVDTSVTLTGLTLLGGEGPYGPFALRSRQNPSGQIIDANLNFGQVYITSKEAAFPAAPTVAFAPDSLNIVRTQGVALQFTIKLSRGLWRRDLFKITTDPRFALAANFNCTSEDISGKENVFNGTHAEYPHTLDCVASEKVQGQSQVLWVYGLAVDVPAKQDTTVKLQVPGFINPDRDYDTTSYKWTIETVRFATSQTIESGVAIGPDTAPAAITAVTWKPTWGLSPALIVPQLELYTDFAFSTINPVPAAGIISISISESVKTISGVIDCYIINDIGLPTCTVQAPNTIKVQNFNALDSGTTIYLRFITKINSSAGSKITVTTIWTGDSAGKAIDSGTSIVCFTVASASAAGFVKMSVLLTDPFGAEQNKAGGTEDSRQSVVFRMESMGAALKTSAQFEIYCPIAEALDDFQLSAPTPRLEYKDDGGLDYTAFTGTVGGQPISNHGTSPTLKSGSITQSVTPWRYIAGSIMFTVGANLDSQSAVSFRLASSGRLTLPRIASNPATVHECRVQIMNSGQPRLIGSAQFVVKPQDFKLLAYTYFCASGGVAGAPMKVQFQPAVVDLQASTGQRTYYLEIGMPADFPLFHNSGMAEGDAYPVDSNMSTGVTMTLSKTSLPGTATFSHLVTGFGFISVGTVVDIYFPVAGGVSFTPLITAQTYYWQKGDARQMKYITHLGTSSSYPISTSISVGTTSSNLSSLSGTLVNGDSQGSTVAFSATLASPITGDTYFFIVFPKGYAFTSLRDVRSSAPAPSSFAEKKFFSSPSGKFKFPGVLVKTTTAGAQISADSSTTISVAGVTAPLGWSASDLVFVHASLEGDLTKRCSEWGKLTLTSARGVIPRWQVSPTSIKGRGPGGVDVAQTVSITLPHGIGAGGRIEFSIDSNWGITSFTTCSVFGINDASCEVQTGSTYKISGFGDFSKVENTPLSINLQRLLAPSVPQDSAIKFLTALTSYTAEGVEIDSLDAVGSGLVTVQKPVAPGTSTLLKAKSYPANAGTTASNVYNDLYLSFSLSYDLPAQSILQLTVPYPLLPPGTSLRDNCWMSPLTYSQCVVDEGVKITLAQSYTALSPLEVFLRKAVTAPGDVTGTYSFKAKASWADATIIADALPSGSLTPAAKVNPSDFASSISLYPANAGAVASYTFNFLLTKDLTPTDELQIVWPDDFSPSLGDAEELLSEDPGHFYLPCRSDLLGAITCLVDHWVLVIRGFPAIASTTPIALTVDGVHTPGAVTSAFRLLHLSSAGELVEFSNSLGTVKLQPLPKLLQVRTAQAESPQLRSATDYTFTFYLPSAVSDTAWLRLQFPAEVDLGSADYGCAVAFLNETTGAATSSYIGLCSQADNILTVDVANVTGSGYSTLAVSGVPTPDFGFVRNAPSRTADFDVQYSAVYSPFSDWMHKIQFSVFNNATSSFTSFSYDSTHSGYLGFKQSLKSLYVNMYEPRERSNRIVVYPGTQTEDLYISTANSSAPLSLLWLHMRPTAPEGLVVTSTHNFNMSYFDHRVPFRVAARGTLKPGLYYISWTKTESARSGVSAPQYADVPDTLVEVPEYSEKLYVFTVAEVPPVAVGYSSVPVSVTVPHLPFDTLQVQIEPEANVQAFVKVSVTSLSFSREMNTPKLNFTVFVKSEFDVTARTSFNVEYKLLGTDARAYDIQPASKVTVTALLPATSGKIVKLGISNIDRTQATIAPVTDQPGVVYYQVAAKGRRIPSFEELKGLEPYLVETQSVPDEEDTWIGLQLRMFQKHVTEFRKEGTIAMVSTTATEDEALSGLWAGTEYQVAAYLDVLAGDSDPPLALEYFTTRAVAPGTQFSLILDGNVPETKGNVTTIYAALRLNVDPSRLANFQRTENKMQRRLQTSGSSVITTEIVSTNFTYTLLPDRSIEQPTPQEQCNLTSQSVRDLADDLALKQVTLIGYELVPASPAVTPQWVKRMEIDQYSETSAYILLKSSVNGRACCAALEDVNPSLQPEQVTLGFSYNWTAVSFACVDVNATGGVDTVMLAALRPDTNYYIHCTATDDALLWPTQMKYTSTVPIPFIPLHTSLPRETPEAAMLLVLSLLSLI